MKRIKLLLLSAAIILGTAGAFASKFITPTPPGCGTSPQYYLDRASGQYLPAGTLGEDYICVGSSDNCTYVKVGDTFVPCMAGINLRTDLKAAHKK